MEVVLGKIDAAAILGDERVSVSKLAAWPIQLQACAARYPNCGDALVIQRCGKLVQSSGRFACDRDKIIDS